MLRERQVDEGPKIGERLAVHESPPDIGVTLVHSIEQEQVTIYDKESLRKFLFEDEATYQFATNLAAGLATSPIGKLSTEVKSTAGAKFKTSFSSSVRLQTSVTERKTIKFELTYTIDPHVTTRYASVAVYQKYAYDIYLAFVDYLVIEYKRSFLGLRKKRKKRPVPHTRRHPNVEKFNIPFASVYFWKLLPKSSIIIEESKYENQVKDPLEMTVTPPEDTHRYHVTMPDVPTLYQLSNVAFPLKWIEREGPWTEQELMQIEMEEAEGTAWWWKYGPGSRR